MLTHPVQNIPRAGGTARPRITGLGTLLSKMLELTVLVTGCVIAVLTYRAVTGQLMVLSGQLQMNTQSNKISFLGQLYQAQSAQSANDANDRSGVLHTLWALVPPEVKGEDYSRAMLSLVTRDDAAIRAKNAAELYHAMYDVQVLQDEKRREATQDLRRLFLAAQDSFYAVHVAYDYSQDDIVSRGQWQTWKGTLREMHGHPVLLAVIWQGYQNRYFSRKFGRFLQEELCADPTPADVSDARDYARNREFMRQYYPEMLKKDWVEPLPDY